MDYEHVTVPLAKLRLNTENDRHGPLGSQRDCIHWMLTQLGDEIYKLARDISAKGLSPLDGILVLPAGEEAPEEYIVWEGNRRVTALKLLENPDRCDDPKQARRFRELRDNADSLPTELDCVLANSEEEAERLIELRHQGPQDGIGTVPWNGAQKSRHLERLGKRGRYSFSHELLDGVADKLDEELRNKVFNPHFAISTLDRLLKNPDVREFLGLTNEEGRPRRLLHETEMMKGLSKILEDIADGDLPVRSVYTAEQQRDYIKQFDNDETPDRSKKLKDSVAVTKPDNTGHTTTTQPLPRSRPASRLRKKLIPGDVRYSIRDARLNDLYRELRTLQVEQFRNSVAITFRVFLELATELYLDAQGVAYHDFNDKLHQKVEKALKHAEANGWLEKKLAKGIRSQITNRKSLFGADSLNAYVHSRHFHPVATDLNTHWDNLQPYFEAILSHLD